MVAHWISLVGLLHDDPLFLEAAICMCVHVHSHGNHLMCHKVLSSPCFQTHVVLLMGGGATKHVIPTPKRPLNLPGLPSLSHLVLGASHLPQGSEIVTEHTVEKVLCSMQSHEGKETVWKGTLGSANHIIIMIIIIILHVSSPKTRCVSRRPYVSSIINILNQSCGMNPMVFA